MILMVRNCKVPLLCLCHAEIHAFTAAVTHHFFLHIITENDNVVGSDDNDSDTDGNLKQKLAGSPPITPSHVSLDLYLNL